MHDIIKYLFFIFTNNFNITINIVNRAEQGPDLTSIFQNFVCMSLYLDEMQLHHHSLTNVDELWNKDTLYKGKTTYV